jgi:hypothetical protein
LEADARAHRIAARRCHAPQGYAKRNPAQGTRGEWQALCAKRRGCRTGKLRKAANAQDGILSLRTVPAGALATMMPLRNAPPVTVPGRMRAVATKACRLALSARRTCSAGFDAADDRGWGAGPAPVWLRSSGGRVEPVAVSGFALKGGGWAGLMNLQGVPCLKLPQAILRPRRAGRTERQPRGSAKRGAAGSGRTASVLEIRMGCACVSARTRRAVAGG